jgi:hypothetical protein
MKPFLATVLSVIAAGVLLIAYGLLSPRVAAVPAGIVQYDARSDAYQLARPVSERIDLAADPSAPYAVRTAMPYPATVVRPSPAYEPYAAPAPAPRAVVTSTAPRTVTRVERAPQRDWAKTAMVIGGSSAAGAGLGAIVGGKKGALIGAAIGGGAGTLYEVKHK